MLEVKAVLGGNGNGQDVPVGDLGVCRWLLRYHDRELCDEIDVATVISGFVVVEIADM